MKAITVEPHAHESARLEDVPEPDACGGSVLVEANAVGVCGTDVEIVEGKYGWAPAREDPARARPRVFGPRGGSGLERLAAKGDLVVGIVRRPDPEPCPSCVVLWNNVVVGSVNANKRH